MNLDHVRAKQWKDLLVASGIDTQIISCYGGYEDVVLRWAEAIPIWYLQKYITNGLYIADTMFFFLYSLLSRSTGYHYVSPSLCGYIQLLFSLL